MSKRKFKNSDDSVPLIQDGTEEQGTLCSVILVELLALFKIAIPVIITNLSAFLLMTESIIMMGQKDKYDFDASSLANSLINVAGIAVGTGLCTACDTFFSQMYSSKHRKSIGMILQKSIMIISLFPIVLIALHINMEPIFILMKQDVTVARRAAKYMVWFSPGLIFAFNFLILTRYMQSQNKVFPPMIIGICVNIFNVVAQYVSIHVLDFGLYASAVCQAISFFLFWILQLLYVYFSNFYTDTWNGWTKDSFLEWGLFAKLAIPGATMVVLECACFEIGTILSGIMGTVHLGTQSILFQLETITFMISFGVGVAVNIRVGQALGAGRPEMALRSYRCGLILMIISFCVTSSLLLGLMNHLPALFTTDKEVREMAAGLLPYLVGVQFFDAIGTVTMGALRGCGRQKICVLIIFCSYYMLGQPIGISLAFAVDMKVKGLWIGLLVSLAICVPIAFIYTNFIQDWKLQAEKCSARISKAAMEEEKQLEEECSDVNTMHMSATYGTVSMSHARSFSKSFVIKPDDNIMTTRMIVVDDNIYRNNIVKRFLILLAVVVVLIGAVMVHIYLPESAYLKNATRF